jgi:NADH dehydrogenase (ubiquinone) Fe-S protein 1
MWEIAPSLVHYDTAEATTSALALAGLSLLESKRGLKASGKPLTKPIQNFYQTDPISRA